MVGNVTASIVVNFSDGGDSGNGILMAEIDRRSDGLNNGKSTFYPGDSVGFLLYKGSNVNIDSVVSSAGSIGPAGLQSITVKETVQFADKKVGTLQYPAKAIGGYKWLGNDGGQPSLVDEVNLHIEEDIVGVLQVIYSTEAYGYVLSGVPHPLSGEYTYDVLVVVGASTISDLEG